ncbi:GAP family protein [Rhodococcus gannanensis]|uniref:GAP family protein n=1 Tax=Rhodococcus gannanensis TaxID=1960308 RepID=A0ABW4P8Q5_9NOCA
MTTAIVLSLPIAFGLALAAMPMVMLSTVLITTRPARVSYAFVGGWVGGLIAAGAVVLTVVDVIALAAEPTWWVGALKLTLGVLLVVLAVRKWRARPRNGQDPTLPRWMAAAQTMTEARALRLGFLLAAANPKNLALVAAGATVIADATPRVHEQVIALIVFAVVASLTVGAPAVVRVALADSADRTLDAAGTWMTRHNAAIMAAVLLVLGVALIGNGAATL